MYNLSEVIGKKAIGLYEAAFAGKISDARLDKTLTKIKYFEVIKDGERKFFAPECVTEIGSDAVMLKNLGKLSGRFSVPPVFAPSPVGTPVFNQSGNSLGAVTDVTVDGCTVKEIIVSGVGYTPEKILSRSDELIIINDSGKKVRLIPPVTKVPSPETGENITVKTHTVKPPVPVIVPEQNDKTQSAKVTTMPSVDIPVAEPKPVTVPKLLNGDNVSVAASGASDDKRASGYAFLLGKTVTKAIKTDDGAIIFSEGDTVDETGLTAATNANKLVQLALHSR